MEETSIIPNTKNNPKPYNMDPNIEAMFSYLPLLGIFTSLAIFIMEKENKFVRFHALQGLMFAVVFFIVIFILKLFNFLHFLKPSINLAGFLIWGFMMWKTYNNKQIELPLVGKIAKDQIK